jgi:putative transposase
MPRKKTFRTPDYPYHVTARSSNQEWFYLPMDQVWQIFMNYLWFISEAYKVRIHAFVLMDNHFHLLVRTPEANIDEAMHYLLREVSKTIGIEANRKNYIFGGPYHWSVIKNSIYYHHAYKYVYRNPVHAGICKKAEDYPYSTLRGLLGREQLLLPVADNMCLIQDAYRQLEWINRDFKSEDQTAIRTALRHREFSFPKERTTGRKHHLENQVV